MPKKLDVGLVHTGSDCAQEGVSAPDGCHVREIWKRLNLKMRLQLPYEGLEGAARYERAAQTDGQDASAREVISRADGLPGQHELVACLT